MDLSQVVKLVVMMVECTKHKKTHHGEWSVIEGDPNCISRQSFDWLTASPQRGVQLFLVEFDTLQSDIMMLNIAKDNLNLNITININININPNINVTYLVE